MSQIKFQNRAKEEERNILTEGVDPMDKLQAKRNCTNCLHFKVCKIYPIAKETVGQYAEGIIKMEQLAFICNQFREDK